MKIKLRLSSRHKIAKAIQAPARPSLFKRAPEILDGAKNFILKSWKMAEFNSEISQNSCPKGNSILAITVFH
jgi:hypothetical protein